MAHNAPGKHYRDGISLLELNNLFPDEDAARQWFEDQLWPDGQRACPRCGSDQTHRGPNENPMPYHCAECRKYFSVRTGTALERSKVPLRKWAFGISPRPCCARCPRTRPRIRCPRRLRMSKTQAQKLARKPIRMPTDRIQANAVASARECGKTQ